MKLKALALAVFVVTTGCSFSETSESSASQSSPSPAADKAQSTVRTVRKLPTKASSTKVMERQRNKETTSINTTAIRVAHNSTHNNQTSSTPGTEKPATGTHSGQPSSVSSSKKPTKSTHSNTVTVAPEIPCGVRNESCSKCVEDSDCFYCNVDKTCRKNTGKIIPTGCKGNKWYWKQCKILGNILIIIISSVGGVFLLTFGCCIYCCCCRRCSKNRAAREEARQQQRRLDRQGRNADRKKSRKERHDAIRLKYGLLENMDDDNDRLA